MSIVLSAVLILIIVLFTVIGAKKGFFATIGAFFKNILHQIAEMSRIFSIFIDFDGFM